MASGLYMLIFDAVYGSRTLFLLLFTLAESDPAKTRLGRPLAMALFTE